MELLHLVYPLHLVQMSHILLRFFGMQDLVLLALIDLVLVLGYMLIPLVSVFDSLFQQLLRLHLL